jgi:hypothetical protein
LRRIGRSAHEHESLVPIQHVQTVRHKLWCKSCWSGDM